MNDPSRNSAKLRRCGKVRRVIAAALVCFAFLFQGVLLPFAVKTKPLSDFYTIYRGTNEFWNAENVYDGANPYLPGIYVLMGWQAVVSPSVAWALWRAIGVAVLASTVWVALRSPDLPRNWFVRRLCLANVLLLAGMSPRWGNPGNWAGMLVVLGWFLTGMRQVTLGGLLMGLAIVLKYNIALPFVVLLGATRQSRAAITAVVVWVVFTVTGFGVLWVQGYGPQEVFQSVRFGIQHVGGYDTSGFNRWFASNNPNSFQLLSITPLLHGFGLRPEIANTFALVCGLVTGVLALERAYRCPTHLAGLAIVAPAILLFTYHRFYDSAILAFPVIAAWQEVARHRRWAWIAIGASCAIFFNISNLIQTRSVLPATFYDSFVWRLVLGPHHVYCLLFILIWAIVAGYSRIFETASPKKVGT